MILYAPAKVNLTLDVFGARTDGFHEIDSVVVPFSPCDALTLDLVPGEVDSVELRCSDPKLPSGPANLAYRAAATFAARIGLPQKSRVVLQLEKFLPFEAGLGGGSSDAAAVLMGLARSVPTDPEMLREIAATIGSDVPLFLDKAPVRVTGRGEIVAKIERQMPTLHGVFVKPSVGVPTGSAYALLDALPARHSSSTAQLLELLKGSPSVTEIGAVLHNDFEAAVFPAFPPVQEAHAALVAAGAVRALLCGSGSAIFGLARDEDHACDLEDRLKHRFPYVERAASFAWTSDAE